MLSEAGLLSEQEFLTLDQFADRVRRASTVLAEAGVTAGTAIALLLRNGSALLEASMAAQHLGAYAVPINWHFASPEVGYVLSDCGATVLIGEHDLLRDIAPWTPQGVKIFAVGSGPGLSATTDWRDAVAAALPCAMEEHAPTESMIYTSGTTGKPKGVKRAPATTCQAAGIAAMRRRIYGHMRGMRALLSAPLYHSAPNYFALSTLRLGGTLILQRKFDPEETLRLIESQKITHLFMVPTMFVRLLALPDDLRRRFDVSTLKWVLHAGAPCPAHIKARMIEWWGPVLTEYYGSTELGPLTFCDSTEWLAHRGTVGRTLDGVELTIRDTDGSLCDKGAPGEIVVTRTPQSDFTYHGNEAKRQEMETGAGLASGDIGYLDDEGYLYLCDRRTNMVISGGVNIYPAEIEAAIMTIEGIEDCAVIGVPDDEFGERLVAFVQRRARADLTARTIETALRDRIAGYKVPREFHFPQALPRDENGKIFKRKLRQQMCPSPTEHLPNTGSEAYDER